MDKSPGTLLLFWGVFQFTQVQPLSSPHKKCWTRVSRFFFRVSIFYRVGWGRTARKFRKGCTVLRGNRETTEKYEYWSTVTRIVVYVATFKNTYALFLWLTPPWFGMKDDQDQEIRTSTGSNAFSLFICLDSNKFELLSFFSLMNTIYQRVWTKPLTNDTKSPLPVDTRRILTF